MNLTKDSWMVGVYRGYALRGGRTREPENLCRFIRVVCLWAPWRWFWCKKKGSDYPEPAFLALLGSILIFFLGFLGFQAGTTIETQGFVGIYGPIIHPPAYALWIIGVGVCVAASVLIGTGLWDLWWQRYKDARESGLCKFIQIGEPLTPVELASAAQIGEALESLAEEEEKDDALLAAARNAICGCLPPIHGYEKVPFEWTHVQGCWYPALRDAIAQEDAE